MAHEATDPGRGLNNGIPMEFELIYGMENAYGKGWSYGIHEWRDEHFPGDWNGLLWQ